MDRQLQVGQIAPNFIAIDDQKKQVSLTELIHHTHLLLAFIHGTWCPHCIQTIYRPLELGLSDSCQCVL